MNDFEIKCKILFESIGEYKKMVLSTSANNDVTSRMMSIIIIDRKFYFQTDKTFRKYRQLKENAKASLCIDNIQIEGVCTEIGKPLEHKVFSELFEKYFANSYKNYTKLENERLFELKPSFVKKWIYENKVPFEEIWEFEKKNYMKVQYIGE